jgi:hypothetical protein
VAQAQHLPLYLRGGVTPHVAAACHAIGMAGVVLDSQVLLLEDAGSDALVALLGNLSGNEAQAIGDGEHGEYIRCWCAPATTPRASWPWKARVPASSASRAWCRARSTG